MKRHTLSSFTGPLFILLTALVLLICEHTLLYRAQELSLWLPTRLWFETRMTAPAGLLTWTNELLTQFFYYPWLGTLLLAMLWMAAYALVIRLYDIPSRYNVVALLPVALLVGCTVEAGYWIFHIKTPGYLFSAATGFDVALLLAWLLRRLRCVWARMGCMTVTAALLFPLFGFYALLALLLTTLLTVVRDRSATRWVVAVWALVLIAVAPAMWYHLLTMSRLEMIYLAGIPAFKLNASHLCFWAPYLLLTAVLVALCFPLLCGETAEDGGGEAPCTTRRRLASNGVVVLASALLVVLYWYKDPCFRTEIKMEDAIERQNYAAALRVARQQDKRAAKAQPSRVKREAALSKKKRSLESALADGTLPQTEYDKTHAEIEKKLNRIWRKTQPSRLVVMLRNLALLKTGTSGREMFHYAEGGSLPVKPFDVLLVETGGKMLYYHYGMFNYCYRWCMEDGVEFGWKTEYLKYMVRCSLLSGDIAVAQKYNDMLAQTLFHRRWAKEMQSYLDEPAKVNQNKEFASILPLYCYPDLLDGDKSLIELYLVNFFARSFDDHLSPLFVQAGMMSALTLKDASLFWQNFRRYLTTFPDAPMPVHYQEAALLFGTLEPGRVDIDHMPFDPKVRTTFEAFRDYATRNALGSKPEANIMLREQFRKRFGHTYYYFYFFVNDIKTY